MPLGYGVIGSPTGSGPVSLGSSPGTPASSADSADTIWCPRLFISGGTVLLKACLNGGTTRDTHPSVPQTPAELAADASAVTAAGAGAVHVHPRDWSGAETLDPDCVLAAVAAIRAAVPGTPVGVTTGLWVAGGDPARRMSLVARWVGSDRPDFASVNLSEPGAEDLAGLLTDLGIAVEAGVWSADDA